MSDPTLPDDPLERLYREGRPEQPPAALDQRIQAAAQGAAARNAALATGRDRRPPAVRSLWLAGGAGFASAAVLLLSVSLLLRQPDPALPWPPPPGLEILAPEPASLSSGPVAADAGPAPNPNADMTADDRETSELAPPARQAAPAAAAATAAERSTGFASAAGKRAAAPAAAQLMLAGCEAPWDVPPGARISPLPDGLRVSVDGQSYTLRCDGGSWVRGAPGADREPDPAEPQSNR